MEIRNTSPAQNFGAKYISTTKIKEKIPFTPFYKKVDVDFVELDRRYDLPSIKTYIARDSYCALGIDLLTNLQSANPPGTYRAFALTRQRLGHEELAPEKILGFCDGVYSCDWRDGNVFFIKNLETKSKNNKLRRPDKKSMSFLGMQFTVADKCKGLGKAILKNIIRLHTGSLDSIQLKAKHNAKSFYRHLGFVDDCLNPDYFRLPSEKFKNLMKY